MGGEPIGGEESLVTVVTLPLVVRLLPVVLLRVKLKLIALLEMMLKVGLCLVADVVRVTTPVTGVILMIVISISMSVLLVISFLVATCKVVILVEFAV